MLFAQAAGPLLMKFSMEIADNLDTAMRSIVTLSPKTLHLDAKLVNYLRTSIVTLLWIVIVFIIRY